MAGPFGDTRMLVRTSTGLSKVKARERQPYTEPTAVLIARAGPVPEAVMHLTLVSVSQIEEAHAVTPTST